MPKIVEVEVFTLGELKALQHKGFQGSIERMRQWMYMDADAYAREVIETTLHNAFGRHGLTLIEWNPTPASIGCKGRVYVKDINWKHPILQGQQLVSPVSAASFTVRDLPVGYGIGCRAGWDYDDIDNVSDTDLLLASELLEEFFDAIMIRVLDLAIEEHDAMMSDDALIEHADEVGIQWLPDGRPLY